MGQVKAEISGGIHFKTILAYVLVTRDFNRKVSEKETLRQQWQHEYAA